MQVTWIERAKELEKSGDDYEKIAKTLNKEGQRSARSKPISANMVSNHLVALGVRRRVVAGRRPKAKTVSATKKPNPSISALVGAIIGFALAILLAFLFASPSFAPRVIIHIPPVASMINLRNPLKMLDHFDRLRAQ
jgi:hypothetical protein